MTARTHDFFALASLLTIGTYFPPSGLNISTTIGSFIGCVIGALIPDMDQSTNRLWDLLPAGDYLGKFLRRIFLGHRTLSHSLVGMFLLYKLLEWILPKFLNSDFISIQIVIYSIMIGFISHMVADSITEEGVPLLFPISFKFGFPPIKSWRIVTGKWFENLVIFPSLAAYLFIFIFYHYTEIINIFKIITS